MPLSRIVYFSENELDPNKGSVISQLSDILIASNRNNKLLDITGALVFDQTWFIQVLEGERRVILKTFERLKNDIRHSNITLVELTGIKTRVFGNWWMGLAVRNEITESAFAPYLGQGTLSLEELSGQQLLELTQNAAKLGYDRQIVDQTSGTA